MQVALRDTNLISIFSKSKSISPPGGAFDTLSLLENGIKVMPR